MAQQLAEVSGPTEPDLPTMTVSLLDVSALTPEVRALLRVQGRLTALEVAELYGPTRLPRTYTRAEALQLVDALERLGIAARADGAAQHWELPGTRP